MSIEKDYSWLESPGALSNGNERPPGQTKQEAQLKKSKILTPEQVVNPEFLESSYNLPLGWTNPQEERSALELLAEMELCAIAALPLETPNDSVSGSDVGASGCGMCGWIPVNFLEDKKQSPSIEPLNLFLIESNTTPENSSEESTADTKQLPSRKRRQRKGCLYKYLENKKLKNGNIALYPRVIGETRDPDNPKRWGFNWEEKIDGEWKGRSIGSVPIGAITLIQSMQKSGVPLEEIIGFIRRSKNKR